MLVLHVENCRFKSDPLLTYNGGACSKGATLLCKQCVVGSIPTVSTNFIAERTLVS